MKTSLRACLLAPLLLLAATASFAVDSSPPANDKLNAARARIAEKNWPAAVEELKKVNDPASADWNNLMGYSLRKQGAGSLRRGGGLLQHGAAHRSEAPRGARILGPALSHDR